MPGPDALAPPIELDALWWFAFPVFVVLAVAWILLSRRIARARVAPVEDELEALDIPWQPRIDFRLQALQRVRVVEQALAAGTLTVRDAHVELSLIVREFAARQTGLETDTMTLEELRRAGLDRVAAVIDSFYPVVFAPATASTVDDSIAHVKALVRSWN